MTRTEKFKELHTQLINENIRHDVNLSSPIDMIRLSAEFDECLAMTRQYNQEYKHNKAYSKCKE